MAEPNYFTCTLGQAAALGLQQPHKTIIPFLRAQANEIPNRPAIGFAKPSTSSDVQWTSSIWTFAGVWNLANRTAARIRDEHWPEEVARPSVVALLCPSTSEFLFTWLALIRLGQAVLLIAPQCTPAAIANLCHGSEVTMLFADEVYSSQASEAASIARSKHGHDLRALPLPSNSDGLAEGAQPAQYENDCLAIPNSKPHDVAYLHHTSGTSSGMPKPIPQTHNGAVGVLPSFQDGNQYATFTSTPLYHGGPADIFRAWTSGAMIWLFPGKAVPITALNIVRCLDVSKNETAINGVPPVKYFSSVPYVLQAMEADEQGLRYLQDMEIVGVGGAALPAEVGDRLVNNGCNLVSRYGSAECGFLMSSHRDYAKDKEWQYLRSHSGAEDMRFEEQANGDGLKELVVLPNWPHMAKRNRDDGSFATSDLFAAHAELSNAWKYHSRADSQLTLITGKKFDPAPLEDALAAHELVEDVLIFGESQAFAGALLFRSTAAKDLDDDQLIERLWPVVEKMNGESQDHARLGRQMLVAMPLLDEPLEKSSKGTLLRGVVQKRFAKDIERVYSHAGDDIVDEVSDAELIGTIRTIVRDVTGKSNELGDETILFSYGVDSIAGMQIRHKLQRLLPPNDCVMPINVVEDCGTVSSLADYIMKRRHGVAVETQKDSHAFMQELVERYSQFTEGFISTHMNGVCTRKIMEVVVLTGATGALGAHVLDIYRQASNVSKIYCLVRGASEHAAYERVNKALQQRLLPALGARRGKASVKVLQTRLGDANLGLDQKQYDQVAKEATVIMHLAWSVNFRMNLRSFAQDSIASVTNLVNLALASKGRQPPVFAYCSSVASMMASGSNPILESIDSDPAAPTELGYSQSKWVAEQICDRANQITRLSGRIAVFRVGQLSGDTQHGVWNSREAWPMMLSASKRTKTLPILQNEHLSWLPVDIAATAMVQGAKFVSETSHDAGTRVFHVLNEHRSPDWGALLGWMRKLEGVEGVTPERWLEQLEDAEPRVPALSLLEHFRSMFGSSTRSRVGEGGAEDAEKSKSTEQTFAMDATKSAIPCLRTVDPLDEAYFEKLWVWIRDSM